MCTGENDVHARALCLLRFYVYRIYREGRYLGSLESVNSLVDSNIVRVHRELWEKGFEESKKPYAEAYSNTLKSVDAQAIERPFIELTGGLTLDDLSGLFISDLDLVSTNSVGGHRWHDISIETRLLRDALADGVETSVHELVSKLPLLLDNSGRPPSKNFDELLSHLKALGLVVPDSCCIKNYA